MARDGRVHAIVLVLAALSAALVAFAASSGWAVHGLPPTPMSPARITAAGWAGLFVLGWTLMIGAMMLPSTIPFLTAASRIGGARAAIAAGGNYVALWALLGIALCCAFWLGGGPLRRLTFDARLQLAGLSLVGAAVFQMTPLARRCQRACAQPFAIFARCWRGRRARPTGAAAAGRRYALSCMACCAGMIVVMVLVGLHDILWMSVLAAAMIAQKNLRWGGAFAALSSVMLTAAGVAMLAGWWTPPLLSLVTLCGG